MRHPNFADVDVFKVINTNASVFGYGEMYYINVRVWTSWHIQYSRYAFKQNGLGRCHYCYYAWVGYVIKMCLAGLWFCVHRGYVGFLLRVSTLSTSRKQKTKATKRRRKAMGREVEDERKDDTPHFEPIRDIHADAASTVQDRLRSPARNE